MVDDPITEETPRDAAEREEGQVEHDARTSGKPGGRDGQKDAEGRGKKKDRKGEIIVASSILLVIIAWISYRKSSSNNAAAAGGAPVGYTSAAAQQAALGAGSVAGAGDPTASAGLASYLENLQNQLDLIAAGSQKPGGSTATGTGTPPLAKPMPKAGFYQNQENGAIWQIQDGKRYRIGTKAWRSFGKKHPPVTRVLPNNPIFNTPFAGYVP